MGDLLLAFPWKRGPIMIQSNTFEMEPLSRTSLGIATDHLTITHLVTEAISWFVSVWLVVIVVPGVVSPSGVFTSRWCSALPGGLDCRQHGRGSSSRDRSPLFMAPLRCSRYRYRSSPTHRRTIAAVSTLGVPRWSRPWVGSSRSSFCKGSQRWCRGLTRSAAFGLHRTEQRCRWDNRGRWLPLWFALFDRLGRAALLFIAAAVRGWRFWRGRKHNFCFGSGGFRFRGWGNDWVFLLSLRLCRRLRPIALGNRVGRARKHAIRLV
ncbi:hypothetical protein B0T14DRAFT_118403 [Immersiella caudata]|uniref:Uncharacterized protein n=1 Tax=Immersiella caudata TaxID=314043 RepID=A0AA39X3V1_9PEZI|nr:hypothetical protein B0T14DRAFT_118403 [Immersiella caudata]